MNREILSVLSQFHQEHVIKAYEKGLSLQNLNPETLKKEFLTYEKPIYKKRFYKPYSDVKDTNESELGRSILRKGEVVTCILAGGQATRLNGEGPKGCFPITNVKKKSLFQTYAERVFFAGKSSEFPLELSIMTSKENHNETVQYFKSNHFFGLEDRVSFFSQGALPLLDEQGKIIITENNEILMGADGNGSFFWNLAKSHLLEKWQSLGVKYITVQNIDNPLNDPFDEKFIGFHVKEGNEVSLKVVLKKSPNEKVGVLVEEDERLAIVEYCEMSQEDKEAVDSLGNLQYRYANISSFCFSLDFIKRVAESSISTLPLHGGKKKATSDLKGRYGKLPEEFWKFEFFIFDALFHAKKLGCQLFERKICFQPLKTANGEDSIEDVKKALLECDREVFEKITGNRVSESIFELSKEFYYPTEEFKRRWMGKVLNGKDYIDSFF